MPVPWVAPRAVLLVAVAVTPGSPSYGDAVAAAAAATVAAVDKGDKREENY